MEVGAVRLGALAAVVAFAVLPATAIAGASSCAKLRAHREVAPIEAYDAKPGAPRVFAMQPKQDPRNVLTYGAFRRKIDCMIREVVVPRLARDRPNVVVLNEDMPTTSSRCSPATWPTSPSTASRRSRSGA
jgi:hypothetical protein